MSTSDSVSESPSPGPPSPSSSTSTSSVQEDLLPADPADPTVPRTGSEPHEDAVICQWDDCGIAFNHLPTLINHLKEDHIGVHKSNYTCEWASCSRRGLAQTSRFALVSHIRSHTGERPFICSRPGAYATLLSVYIASTLIIGHRLRVGVRTVRLGRSAHAHAPHLRFGPSTRCNEQTADAPHIVEFP
ncbi:hypothetical protein FA95DRAFT_924727 [Auriscalpium vulgare]|uniref:Uncharacterized protein n=1 Tax=Auriscalpium vulgare TaxID=40419 RepID=A0ACB8RZR3_9AGAM|nr:hypothetical protein FA95DRAFT_924727 [Auriscalpium vulgare]